MTVESIGKEFIKPPRRFFGFVFCRHVWKKYWHKLDDFNQVELEKCARCLKDKDKRMGAL